MIKVENNMLILDSSATRRDVDAINEFIRIAKQGEQDRIIKLLDITRMCSCKPTCKTDINIYAFVLEELGIDLFKLIKGGQK